MSTLKPSGWSWTSKAPYYKKRFADDLKPQLDKLLDNPQASLEWNITKHDLRPSSFVNRILQAWAFLMDHDPDGEVYRDLRRSCRVTRDGYRIEVKRSADRGFLGGKLVVVEDNVEAELRAEGSYMYYIQVKEFLKDKGDRLVLEGKFTIKLRNAVEELVPAGYDLVLNTAKKIVIAKEIDENMFKVD